MNKDIPVKLKVENRIAHLILDKPPDNRMNQEFLNSMCDSIKLLLEIKDIGAVIMYGSGRHFSAGADVEYVKSSVIKEYSSNSDVNKKPKDNISEQNRALRMLETLNIPVIAAINGLCMGSGLELALACDIRICDNSAIMGSPELSWGIITGLGGSFRLEKLIGKSRAKEMILTGETIAGHEAYSIGLVNKAVKRKEVLPYALKLAQLFSQKDRNFINCTVKESLITY